MSIKVQIILCPEEQQVQILLDTMVRYNELCNYLSEIVFERKGPKPTLLYYWSVADGSKNLYHHLRKKFPNINANFITLAFRKVGKAYKKKPTEPYVFEGVLDCCNYLISVDFTLPIAENTDTESIGILSISTLAGRQKMHFIFDPADRKALNLAFSRKKYRDFQLTYRENQFYLVTEFNESLVTINRPETECTAAQSNGKVIWS